jgi:hypothetical protein
MAGYTVSSVTTGKYARQISVAASGPQGAQGPAGVKGDKGDIGAAGGLSANFKFLNTYSAGAPGGGYFALNNSSIFSATQMFISEYDSLGASQASILDSAVASTNSNKSVLTLRRLSDGKFSRYYITEQAISAGWRTLDLEYIGGSAFSAWTYNDLLSVEVSPIGDMGLIGPTGPQGEVGPGVPAGGLAGQILRKTADSDYATEWVDPEVIEDVSISELNDVVLTDVGNAQVLVYDDATSRWVNRSTTELGISASNISGTIVGGDANDF